MKLKPCPFCGEEPRWCGNDPEDKHECHQIHCDGCGAQFDVENDIATSRGTIEELRTLIEMTWNTRQSEQQGIEMKLNTNNEQG